MSERKKPLRDVPKLNGSFFLFIGGLHRSGTSILHRVLRDHPSVSGLSNTPAAQDEGQHLQSVYPTASRMGGPGEFAFNTESMMPDIKPEMARLTRGKLLREWGPYFDLDKEVLIEKSPPNLVRSRFFQTVFPDSRFCFIVRHPIVVSLSTQRWTKSSLSHLLQHWYVAYSRLLNDVECLQHKTVFRYEDFVAQPQAHVDSLCDWLHIPRFTAEQLVIDKGSAYFDRISDATAFEATEFCEANPEATVFFASLGYSMTAPFRLAEPTGQWFNESRLLPTGTGER